MNARSNAKNIFSKMVNPLLLKAAALVLAVAMVAAGPGPNTLGAGFSKGFTSSCASLPASSNCSYVIMHLSSANYGTGIGSSVYLPNCQSLAYCGYLWAHSTNGGIAILASKLQLSAVPSVPPFNFQALPASANGGYIQMHLTGSTASAQISSANAQPNCQAYAWCGYILRHNK